MTTRELSPATCDVPIVDLLRADAVRDHFVEQRQPVEATPTPFPTWNRHCRDEGGGVGIPRGWHVTIAANTGVGKSVAALNLGAAAIEAGESVGFVSLEMSRPQLATRLYAIVTGSDIRTLERGSEFAADQAGEVERQVAELRERTGATFLTNERPLFQIDRIQGFMRWLHEQRGIRYFVLDYLQLAAARDAESLFYRVSEVSARVREVAKALNVTTIGLSQLNRSTSANYADKPIVQGVLGSSGVENDSDQVVLLDHSRYRRIDHERRALTWAILGKNRHGGTGEIPIELCYKTLRMREAGPHEEDEWPGA